MERNGASNLKFGVITKFSLINRTKICRIIGASGWTPAVWIQTIYKVTVLLSSKLLKESSHLIFQITLLEDINTLSKRFCHLRTNDDMVCAIIFWLKVDYCFPIIVTVVYYYTSKWWLNPSDLFHRINMTTFVLCIKFKITTRRSEQQRCFPDIYEC